ncbi:unnamed protein product [Cylindrotheca closterium]|uniref:Secreted protein n=1 Tax=Cylindrotheca closterium TaxID=2856 RepID=A0AAD2G6S7_9STRA|nr:unnamed protein product [Cylindrotheca closterium]
MGSWCFGCQLILWLMTWVFIQVPIRPPEEEEGGRRRRRHNHRHQSGQSRWRHRNASIEDIEAEIEAEQHGNQRHHHARRRGRLIRVESDSSGSLDMIDDSLPSPSSIHIPHVV